jgi:uncharacterized protein (TIGR02680 family)
MSQTANGEEPLGNAEQWLTAAASGGLPEPTSRRWQPLRVGLVNMWEYDNTEFWFADGRLVLRGGNGAGKTKVLELTTLMLLRGEAQPSALDPFGSQHRTMRYNLLPTGEGDDPREPTDSGLGYAWAEFGRRDEAGVTHYFTCGLGASAKRGTGTQSVQTWRFITHLRPGHQFRLSTADRPVEHKDLRKIDGVTVLDKAASYRARLAADLFELDTDAYNNLTELLKQLRRPKLGERLNPGSLAETLRDALPPLASNEVDQLAEGWDRLQALRDAVEETKEAAKLLAQFVRSGWRPWASAVVRRRADRLTAATTALDDTTKARRAAEGKLEEARAEVDRLDAERSRHRSRRSDADVERRELLDSQAFQDAVSAAQRAESLREKRTDLQSRHGKAENRVADLERDTAGAAESLSRAKSDVDTAESELAGRVAEADVAAQPAGLAESARRHLTERDAAALHADLDRRTERFERLRELHSTFAEAQRRAEHSGDRVARLAEETERAAQDEREADAEVERAADTLRTEVRDWAAQVSVAMPQHGQVDSWCDLVDELSSDARGPAATPVSAALRAHVTAVRETLTDRRGELIRQRDPMLAERKEKAEQLERIRTTEETPPPQPRLWARRERPEPGEGSGAALWHCVQPSTDQALSDADLARLEATLAASGLLDAWLCPDGTLSTADGGEIFLVAGPGSPGRGLDSVLEPTPAGGVSTEVVSSVLRGIGWYEHGDKDAADGVPTWLAADGRWRNGPLSGLAHEVQPASYLGATAREAAKQRQIAELEGRLAELAEQIDELDAEERGVTGQLATLDTEANAIPSETAVNTALTRLAERRRAHAKRANELSAAQAEHAEREYVRDSAWADVSEFASLYSFPTRDLEAARSALQRYRDALHRFESVLQRVILLTRALTNAEQTLEKQRRGVSQSERDRDELAAELRKTEVRLSTAEQRLEGDHAAQLRRRDDLDSEITRLDGTIETLDSQHADARDVRVRAEATLDSHEERRRIAEQERDASVAAWWAADDAGLLTPLGIPVPERRLIDTARTGAREARRAFPASFDEQAEDRAWRHCYRAMDDLKQKLLPNRDVRTEDEDGSNIPRVRVLADSAAGWQRPHEAADVLAARVAEQEEHYDAEQQRVLTTLLGSTFIEHLKDRLDYTERTFDDINKQLADHPTRHGHAVRLVWQADPSDPDSSAVVSALGQGYQQLSHQRQEMVRSFLARKIDAARADATADGSVDWKEELASKLDYRTWLRIAVEYRAGPASRFAPFDAARHAAKSGGEKVVLLSQPLFAAAVVAYNAAGRYAPRWVWLDEAMTGVDSEVKARFMELTVNFDLDVMLTAHDEWCKYSTVPAVAVYDLARQKNLPGVDAEPWLWCGGQMARVDMLDSQPAMDGLLEAEGLFAGQDLANEDAD